MTIATRLAGAEPRDPRRLGDLVARLVADGLATADGGPVDGDIAVHGVAFDSRAVRPGHVFVAISGLRTDGHAYLGAAQAAGAVAALVERPSPELGLPQVVVRDGRRSLAAAAAWWYGDPSRELGIVGITGTDGKTTTSYLATAALAAAGIRAGMVGTVATRIGGEEEPNPDHATTPEAPALQAALRAMCQAGDRAAVIETTSHGLALDRVAAIAYDAAILTNITHEHLELHGTWEAYRDAKRSLFERLGPNRTPKPDVGWPAVGIVNADDPVAAEFGAITRSAGARLLTYGRADGATVRLTGLDDVGTGLQIAYAAPSGAAELRLRLGGRFNAHNALAVVALGEALELDPAAIRAGLESVAGVPGRMERVDQGQPFAVIVDFAHSPASLELVLDQAKPLAAAGGGGVIAVFGSAGERDRAKRPLMGRIAGARCRLVIVADEDPRGEDGAAIVAEIASAAREAARAAGGGGALPTALVEEIPDRRAAIDAAIDAARPGDVVLLLGKGHEPTIDYADGPRPWNERAEAERALAAHGWTGSGQRA